MFRLAPTQIGSDRVMALLCQIVFGRSQLAAGKFSVAQSCGFTVARLLSVKIYSFPNIFLFDLHSTCCVVRRISDNADVEHIDKVNYC